MQHHKQRHPRQKTTLQVTESMVLPGECSYKHEMKHVNSFSLQTVDLVPSPCPSLCHTTTATTTTTIKSGQQFRDTLSFRCTANGNTICDGCVTPGWLSTNIERKIHKAYDRGTVQAMPHVIIIVFVKQAKLSYIFPSPFTRSYSRL